MTTILHCSGSQRLGFTFTTLFVVSMIVNAGAANAANEPDTVSLSAGEVLPKKWLSGENHQVQDQVVNQGFMNHYQIKSKAGAFKANSNAEAITTINEINAIAKLRGMSKAKVAAESAAGAVAGTVESVSKVLVDPGGTAKGLSSGVGRLLKRTKKKAQDAYEKTQEASAQQGSGASGDSSEVVVEAGKSVAKGFFGVSGAFRKLAQELKIDPYTRNPVLREEMESMAKVAAAGSFGAKMVTPSVPGLGTITKVSDLVWNMNPIDLQLRNEGVLKDMGMREGLIKAFFKNKNHTPTTQTRIVTALEQMKRVEHKVILLDEAAQVENWAEARFYTRSAEFLAAYHKHRSPIVRIVQTDRTPFAVTQDKRAVLMVPVDEVRWTELVALASADLSKQIKPHSSHTELWVGGRISAQAQKEFARIGWMVFDQARERLKSDV